MLIEFKALADFVYGQNWTDFGVVSINALKKALETHEGIFERWLSSGYQAEMGYLKEMKGDRYHPDHKLPDIQSVIVLTAWYGQENEGGQARVARYARGKDYHKVLKKKLLALSDWLKEQEEGVETYASVDSSPTVDRVLAETAGLGFFGKNSNLIDPRRGSYFFIASLMVNEALPVTEKRQMPNCGDCQRCISACPTGAIVAPGVIDARRCIAYLTIENKEGIPVKLRPEIGNRLFGCDICQEVCPFNEGRAGKQEILIEDLKAEKGAGGTLDLGEILKIGTDEEFLGCFAGTPLMRAKRYGLLRNACVVAGNSGDLSLVPVLQELVQRETDETLVEHAKWAIGRLTDNQPQDS